MERGEIRIKNETVAALPRWVLTRGVPLPPGAVREADEVALCDASGTPIPSFGKVLQRRPDGSIEWLLMDSVMDLAGSEKRSIFIETAATGKAPQLTNPVTVDELPDSVRLSNRIITIEIGRTGSLIQRLQMHGKELIKPGALVDLVVADTGGKRFRASVCSGYTLTIPIANPVRTVVRLEGEHIARDGSKLLDFALEFTLTAGSSDLRIDHTFSVRQAADGPVMIAGIELIMPTTMDPAAHKMIRQEHHGHSYQARDLALTENVEVVGSAFADIENYRKVYQPYGGRSHGCAGGKVFIRNEASLAEKGSDYPWYMRPGQEAGFRGDLTVGGIRRVHPSIGWREDDFTLVVAFKRWAQLHPKSVAIDEQELRIGIWPTWSVPLDAAMGLSKTHTLMLGAAPTALDPIGLLHRTMAWEVMGLDTVDVSFDPVWPRTCRVLDCHDLLSYQPTRYPMLENLIEVMPSAGNPNRFTYPRHDASGMLNYGDEGGAGGFTNNEDDVKVLWPLTEYLRTGNTYCFDVGMEAVLHYMEVDFCCWSTDDRQRGGLIPHTVDHYKGNVYPSHQWSEGVLAWYYLTGDERARQAVIAVGDNYRYWVANHLDLICCDGREAGMPLVNLAAAYRLTRNDAYLDAARTIIANFHQKWYDLHGDLRYPYPQSAGPGAHQKWITGYGDWSSYYGLYRLWEASGDDAIRELLIGLLEKMVRPERFGVNDSRTLDFFAVWAYIQLTGCEDEIVELMAPTTTILLRRGGHPLRRLQYLAILDRRGLIDERSVGNRGAII